MPKARSVPYDRLLLRPRAWAGTRTEFVAAASCVAVLALIFVGEVHTPSSVVGMLAMLPVLISTWMLGRRLAGIVVAAAALFVVAEAAAGSIDLLTGVAELVALAIIAGVIRLYASRFDLLFPRLDRAGLERVMPRLSLRERQVVELTVEGHSAPKIAALLHISERTVETHLANAYGKLGVSSKYELVRRAVS